MNRQVEEIPRRIQELREILELSARDVADKLSISIEEYHALEGGRVDIPISTLYELAAVFGVDFTVLLTGDAPKMNTYTVVRAGTGVKVERYEGYSYDDLAFNFIGREMEPMVVTLRADDGHKALVAHPGQEFNYCLEGQVQVTIGSRELVLAPGDSVYFNSALPHGQTALSERAKFLTVIKD